MSAGVLAGLVTAVQVGLGATVWSAADTFERAAADGLSTLDTFAAYDAVGLLLIPAMIAAYVLTCLWLHRCRTNTDVFAPGAPHARSPIWAWLGWWVPVVSLWFPFQVVRDVQRISTEPGPRTGLGLWWAGWLVWAGCGRVTSRLSVSTDVGSADFSALPIVELIGTLALVVSFLCWVRIVREITAAQAARVEG